MNIRCPVATRMLSDIADMLCSWWGAKQCNYPLSEVSSLSGLQTRLHGKLLEDMQLCLPREEVVLPSPLAALLHHAFLQVLSKLVLLDCEAFARVEARGNKLMSTKLLSTDSNGA